MADLFGNLKALRHGDLAISQLDENHLVSLSKLGLVTVAKNAWGQTVASLTPVGRQQLRQLDAESIRPSPVGEAASRELSDAALQALDGLGRGEPPGDLAARVLVSHGLATETDGICVLTPRGHDVLSNRWVQERLQSLLSRHRRG